MSNDRPTLIHNGVGISDLETQDEYDWLMAGQNVPNQTSVSMQDKEPSVNLNSMQNRGIRGKLCTLKFLNNII